MFDFWKLDDNSIKMNWSLGIKNKIWYLQCNENEWCPDLNGWDEMGCLMADIYEGWEHADLQGSIYLSHILHLLVFTVWALVPRSQDIVGWLNKINLKLK